MRNIFIKSVFASHGGLEYTIRVSERISERSSERSYSNGAVDCKFTITASDYREIGEDVLKAGSFIDDEVRTSLEFSAEKLSCIQKSLKHLEYGAMSEKKLRMKLKGKFSQEAIDEALEILKGNGYIDDSRLAFDFCEEYFINQRMSPARIKAKLYEKGFSRETLSIVLEEYEFSDEVIHENLDYIVSRKYGDELSQENKRKALEYLIRQGYSYDTAKEFLKLF